MRARIVNQQKAPVTAILPSKITIALSELSSKQRKSILGLIKDMGFVPEEIREVAVLIHGSTDDRRGAPEMEPRRDPAQDDGK